MTTGLIICGALGREVLDIVRKHGWDADIVAVPAVDHVFPERIASDVEAKFKSDAEPVRAADRGLWRLRIEGGAG